MSDYETKDSGARQEFASGMHRDTQDGKARFDLIIPKGVPYDQQLLTRFAELLGRGAVKYTERNWEQADSQDEIDRAKSSAFRHFMQWFCGEQDEDHAAATLFNIMVVETTETKLEAAEAYEVPDQEFAFQDLGPFLAAIDENTYHVHIGEVPDVGAEGLAAMISDRLYNYGGSRG